MDFDLIDRIEVDEDEGSPLQNGANLVRLASSF
jgi:hypothetical protein